MGWWRVSPNLTLQMFMFWSAHTSEFEKLPGNWWSSLSKWSFSQETPSARRLLKIKWSSHRSRRPCPNPSKGRRRSWRARPGPVVRWLFLFFQTENGRHDDRNYSNWNIKKYITYEILFIHPQISWKPVAGGNQNIMCLTFFQGCHGPGDRPS